MSTSQRARLALVLDLHTSQHGTGVPTLLLTDAEAVSLMNEVGPSEFTHAEGAAVGVVLLKALGAAPAQEDEDALAEWANRRREASAKLWDALSGQVIDGVQIARKGPKPIVPPTEPTDPEA